MARGAGRRGGAGLGALLGAAAAAALLGGAAAARAPPRELSVPGAGGAAAGEGGAPWFCHGIDCPRFEALGTGDGFEIRKYPAAKWASTEVKGLSLDKGLSTGFMRLFNYISVRENPPTFPAPPHPISAPPPPPRQVHRAWGRRVADRHRRAPRRGKTRRRPRSPWRPP